MLERKARFPRWAHTATHPADASQALSSGDIRSWPPLLRSAITEVELRRDAVGTSRLTGTHQRVLSELLLVLLMLQKLLLLLLLLLLVLLLLVLLLLLLLMLLSSSGNLSILF